MRSRIFDLPSKMAGRRQLSRFLLVFVALSAACFVLWQGLLYSNLVLDRSNRIAATGDTVAQAHRSLVRILETYSSDLRVIARNPALRRLGSGNAAARAEVTTDFEAVVAEKPIVAQLRYLDRSGQEIVRVDRRGDRAIVIDGADLQDKHTRYYFQQSIDLPPGTLYVSPIDLNVEHGSIEMPWHPMLRLATPITGADGATVGVVIINISAASFIGTIGEQSPLGGIAVELLNQDGYWLAGVPQDRLWGFVFKRDTTMAASQPAVWQRIAKAGDGTFAMAGSDYLFQTIYPTRDVSRASSGSSPSEVSWTVLAIVPGIGLGALWHREDVPTALIGLLVIAAISWGWSRAVTARREAEARRGEAETEMLRVERLASLGSLVAGIAHELNTPIGNAVTIASTLSDDVTGLEAVLASGQIRRSVMEGFIANMREGTRIMLHGLERASALIGHFKQVAVDQTSEQRRAFRLGELVHDVVATLEPQFKRDAVVLVEDVKARGLMDSYPGPLSQVLMNLIVNARNHAFRDLTIDHEQITVTARDVDPVTVELIVRDNGRGIPESLQQRIFEPFFTTRLGEGGSGLGLSIVFNIVTNVLGGTIRVESRLGKGTAMIVRIPKSAPAAAAEQSGENPDNGQHRQAA